MKTLLVGSQSNLLLAATSTQLVAVTSTFVSASRSAFGGATRSFDPISAIAIGGAAISGNASSTSTRRELATMLECCRSASEAGGRVTLGSATWTASPNTDGDNLARYYPLWLNDREVYDATFPKPLPEVLNALKVTGRDIAHQIDAAGNGGIQDSENGKMCEVPEQFRLSRFYDIPLPTPLAPQPEGSFANGIAIVVKQWEWDAGFTASVLYRYRPVRQEQSLFSLSPAVRLGVSWLGELVVEVTLENGDKINKWSTQRLSTEDWSHIAFTYDSHRKRILVYLNGVLVLEVPFTRPIGDVVGCYLGRWDGGSLMNGDAQDLRIYNSVLRSEFVAAEVNSYCADWVEVAS